MSADAMRIGRFASRRHIGEYPLYANVAGRRFDRIEVTLTTSEFAEPRVHAWICDVLVPRLATQDSVLAIEIRP